MKVPHKSPLAFSVAALLVATSAASSWAAPINHQPESSSVTQGAPTQVTADDRVVMERNSGATVEEKTDQIIVKFKDDTAESEKTEVIEDLDNSTRVAEDADIVKETVDGAEVIDAGTFLNRQEQEDAVEKLEENPEVEFAEPDYIIKGSLAANPGNPPNDPMYRPNQWNLRAIDAAGAWNTATGAGTLIGVADTGQTNHPEFSGKINPGYDFISSPSISRDGDGRDNNPNDEGDWGPNYSPTSTWHGTHVAGIAAAKAGNGIGIAGVAPDARLQFARVMGLDGTAYMSDQAVGIAWLAGVPQAGISNNPTPVGVINYSEGVRLPDGMCPQTLQNAILAAHNRNVPVVASAGNQGINANFVTPANCPGAIVVGSTTINNTMVGYSNWGPMLDVLAPGGNSSAAIWSTKNSGAYRQGTPNYGTLHGTSMAAPHVAGTVAMMKQANPSMTVEQIRETLKNTGSTVNGYKMINARKAVEAAARSNGYQLKGAIGEYYRTHGGNRVFGQPLGNEFKTVNKGYVQQFSKRFSIYWTASTGAHAVKFSGAIGARFAATNWERGYGYPVEDEKPYSYGYRQTFEKNGYQTRIYWSPQTGAHTMNGRGAIFSKWVSMGHAPVVGFPSTDEVKMTGGYAQRFQHSSGKKTVIYWSASTGSHWLNTQGALYSYWTSHGHLSTLGYPTTDEIKHADGSYTVKFSNGVSLRWTATGGVKEVR